MHIRPRFFYLFLASLAFLPKAFASPTSFQCTYDSSDNLAVKCHTISDQPFEFSFTTEEFLSTVQRTVTIYGDLSVQPGCDDAYEPYTGSPCPPTSYTFLVSSKLSYQALKSLLTSVSSAQLFGVGQIECESDWTCSIVISGLES